MENQGAILFFVAMLLIVVFAYLANRKTPGKQEFNQDTSDEDLSPFELRKLELLNKIANNSSNIKSILIFFLVVMIIGFFASIFNMF